VTRRAKSDPRRVGVLLPRVLEELGLGGARLAMRAQERWSEIVGAEAAAHSSPELLRGRTLEVRVDASVWSQQLALRAPEILAALHRLLGEEAPEEIRFRVG
jgi:predicted nucleic acid-binding Zn ribbon protein